MKGQGEANLRPVVLDLGMSQTELGLLLGATQSKVNEALATLENSALPATPAACRIPRGVVEDIDRVTNPRLWDDRTL